jgi:hypothetical protein
VDPVKAPWLQECWYAFPFGIQKFVQRFCGNVVVISNFQVGIFDEAQSEALNGALWTVAKSGECSLLRIPILMSG